MAGVLATAKFSQGSAGVGSPYLIQAFAAVFLGATLFRGSLFNSVGTVIAVVMLGTITVGLALAGIVQQWVPYAFQGLILISALGLGGLRRRPKAPASPTEQQTATEPPGGSPHDPATAGHRPPTPVP